MESRFGVTQFIFCRPLQVPRSGARAEGRPEHDVRSVRASRPALRAEASNRSIGEPFIEVSSVGEATIYASPSIHSIGPFFISSLFIKMNLQFRVDRTNSDVSGCYNDFFSKANYGFVFEHPATDKKVTHIHGYVLDREEIKFKSFGAAVKKTFSLKPNDYETAQTCGKDKRSIDLSGSWAYGSRFGTLRPVWAKNISPAMVEDLQRYSQELGIKIQAARDSRLPKVIELNDQKPDSKIFYDICEAVLQEAKQTPGIYENRLIEANHFGTEVMDLQPVIVKPKAVYQILLKHLKRHRVMTEMNQLTRFMTTILRDDPQQGETLRDAVFRRLNLI